MLSHVYEDGTEKPIAFASRTLNTAERNYSQIEKEGLAVIFAVKKFHDYCYGRCFTIYSDHKPLEGLFGEEKPTSGTSISRIQRWALFLAGYDYKFRYKPGKVHENADGLSRLPAKAENVNIDPEGTKFENIMLLDLDRAPVTAEEVKKQNGKDQKISEVIQCKGSWVGQGLGETKPYHIRRNELSGRRGLIMG